MPTPPPPLPTPRPAHTHPAPPRAAPQWLVVLLVAAAYALAGWVSLKLAIPPGYASPLYPAAGIALACALVYGRPALAGVALGAFIVNAGLSAQRGNLDLAALGLPALIALGAALQAGLGVALTRRFVRQPLTLSEPRDIAAFFVYGAIVASLLNATLASSALRLGGTLSAASWPSTWITWWMGDALGALIAAPVVLTLIGQPRDAWAMRRLPLGLTLSLVTALLALAIAQVARWDTDRVQAAFERDASNASTAIATQLLEPLRALEAIHGVFIASEEVSRDEMRRATQAWLAGGTLQAIGWSERMKRDEVPAFEARMRADDLPGFKVFDRADALPADKGRELVVMRYIEPMKGNSSALGVNVLSIPPARAAIEAATAADRPVATAGFRLTQQAPGEDATGIVIYQPVYEGQPASVAERRAALRGVVFVTLKLDTALAGLSGRFPPHLHLCVLDTDRAAARPRLAGTPGCESADSTRADLTHTRPLAFAGKQWEVRVSARERDLPDGKGANAWLFSLVGLLGAAMLGALLLTVTGRTRRIEAAVNERTAALQAEVQERERAEEAMRESEQRFRNILNNVPIGVIYTDLIGDVKQTNPRFCELTGYSDAELLTMNVHDFTHPDDIAQDVELANQLVRGEIPMYRRQGRYVTKDRRTLWVQGTVTLLRDPDGQPRRIVGAVEDITEHLRLQEAENERDVAEAANRAKSEFLSRMSHELRTPLNAMLGFAQLLELDQRHPLASEQRPWVSQIQQAGWHLLEMINDVLDLSRIESGNLRLHIEPLNLPELLSATISLVNTDARQRGIAITTDLADGTGVLMGDATRVKQILTNLLTNAVKYNHDGGRVHVATRVRDRDVVELAVTDTGLGMSPEQMAELFQPFNRLGRERSSHQGTGIGLVISQRLAELMGGSLRARSLAGEGSSFILALPRAVEPDTVRSDLNPLAPTPAEYHRRIVHYVEDNETNVEVMRGILAQRPQVQMEVSVNGLDGLLAIRQHRPDLVLLDMHLPDISGLELLRHLKADPATAGVPVVVVSADATTKQIDAALAAGATRYLTKPVSVAELLAVVDELMEQAETRFG